MTLFSLHLNQNIYIYILAILNYYIDETQNWKEVDFIELFFSFEICCSD